jgi:hypothetical protein
MKFKAFNLVAVLLGFTLGACSSETSGNPANHTHNPPVISGMELSAAMVRPGAPAVVTVTASATDQATLQYTFSHAGNCGGSFSGEGTAQDGNVGTFNATAVGTCQLKVTVTDSDGLTADRTVTLAVDSIFPVRTTYLNGFENADDEKVWIPNVATIVTDPWIIRTAGTAGFPASAGDHYAVVLNQRDGWYDGQYPGYGDGGVTRFGGKGLTYQGDFYQAVDVYIDVKWAPPTCTPGQSCSPDSFSFDETPARDDAHLDNYGAEHQFNVRATGSQVDVLVDWDSTLIASITKSGWYTFIMTWEKNANDGSKPVVTQAAIYETESHTLVGQTTVYSQDIFPSDMLLGSNYLWISAWQNDFAPDGIAIDNLQTGLLVR